jgi:hypothetical protein
LAAIAARVVLITASSAVAPGHLGAVHIAHDFLGGRAQQSQILPLFMPFSKSAHYLTGDLHNWVGSIKRGSEISRKIVAGQPVAEPIWKTLAELPVYRGSRRLFRPRPGHLQSTGSPTATDKDLAKNIPDYA